MSETSKDRRFRIDRRSWHVSLVTGDRLEAASCEQIRRLLKNYDLKKWTVTRRLRIDRHAVPHSHPVLTLNTKYLSDDNQALAAFLHEQIHWIVADHYEKVEPAIIELQRLFPRAPVKSPRGANGELSTYLHLIVNYLEFKALREILGPALAKSVIRKESRTHYTWIYDAVMRNPTRIESVIRKHDPGLLRRSSEPRTAFSQPRLRRR